MTETRVLNTQNRISKSLAKKPIEFSYVLSDNGNYGPATIPPSFFDVIELISSTRDFDIMRAYDEYDNLEDSMIYLGKWNDGFVEEE